MSFQKKLQAFLFSTSLVAFSMGTCGEECAISNPSRVDVRHRDPRGVGYKKGYTTLDSFITPSGERINQPFANIRGHVFNNGKVAANIGIGTRTFTPSE